MPLCVDYPAHDMIHGKVLGQAYAQPRHTTRTSESLSTRSSHGAPHSQTLALVRRARSALHTLSLGLAAHSRSPCPLRISMSPWTIASLTNRETPASSRRQHSAIGTSLSAFKPSLGRIH